MYDFTGYTMFVLAESNNQFGPGQYKETKENIH